MQVFRQRNLSIILAIVLAVAVMGCGTTGSTPQSAKTVAYKTLKTLHDTYDSTFKALGEAYKAGKITPAQKDEAVARGKEFLKYYNLAVDALIADTVYQDYVTKAQDAVNSLLSFVGPLIGK